jgi:hypothetical protein
LRFAPGAPPPLETARRFAWSLHRRLRSRTYCCRHSRHRVCAAGHRQPAAYPAPPDIAVQIFNRATILTMWAKLHSGQSVPQVIAWAKDEVQGFIR